MKLDEYFRAGVRRVWVIYPQQGYIQDYQAFDRITALRREHALEGSEILPGFSIKLAELFGEDVAAEDSKDV